MAADWTAVADKVHTACTRIGEDAATTDREGRFPRRGLTALAEAGLLGLTVPAEFGGLGAGFSVFARAIEEIAGRCGSTAMVTLMHFCGAMPLVAAGSADLKRRLLPDVAAGKRLLTLAFSEPGSGAHFYFPVSRASARNGSAVLDCDKSFVTSAGEADGYIVATGSAAGSGPAESDLFFVDRSRTGITVNGRWDGLGFRGNSSSPMKFAGVEVPHSERIGAEKGGMGVMLQVVLPWFQLGNAAVNIGLAGAALEASIAHAKGRSYAHSQSRLADVPAIQGLLAEMSQTVSAARAYVRETAAALDGSAPDAMLHVLQVKPIASQAAQDVTAKSIRVCGGAAFAGRLPLERLFRDAQAGAIMAPTTDVLKEFIGKALLGIPLF